MKGFNVSGLHYRQELVKCGKPACKRCPHGPYWYCYHYLMIFMKKTYVGKELPPAVASAIAGGSAEAEDLEEIRHASKPKRRR